MVNKKIYKAIYPTLYLNCKYNDRDYNKTESKNIAEKNER